MGLLNRITALEAPVQLDMESESPDVPDLTLVRSNPEQPLSVRRFTSGQLRHDPFRAVRERVQTQLLRETNRYLKLDDHEAVRGEIVSMLDEALAEDGVAPARVDYLRVLESITNEVLGFGPIQPLLDDESITEVMVNGPDQVFIERRGKLHLSDITFDDEQHVMRVID
jgi:pilus assembly protein CpaF